MNKYQPRWVSVQATSNNPIVIAPRHKTVGQSLVEFALIAPLLLMVIFGIIDIARLIQAQLTIDNAARQAIRFANLVVAVGQDRERQLVPLRPGLGEFLQLRRQDEQARTQRLNLGNYCLQSIQLMPAVGSPEAAEHAHENGTGRQQQ